MLGIFNVQLKSNLYALPDIQHFFCCKSRIRIHFAAGTNPVIMYLSPGTYVFKITPKGCGSKKKALKVTFEV